MNGFLRRCKCCSVCVERVHIVGPEALASGPTLCFFACLLECLDEALDGAPERAVGVRRASVLRAVLLGDVFTDDELAGGTRAELL